jgi:hypothetical protein
LLQLKKNHIQLKSRQPSRENLYASHVGVILRDDNAHTVRAG